AADVEEPRAERERHREPREDQRRRDDQRLLEIRRREIAVRAGRPREEPLEPGSLPDRLVDGDRVLPGDQHYETAHEEREQRRQQRNDDPAAAEVAGQSRGRRLGEELGFLGGAHAAVLPPRPPVMAMPSSSSDTSGGNSLTISPS